MSPIKVGTYAISNINSEFNDIGYYSYMIIDIVQNKSFNVITLENIFNTSDILTIIQTKDGVFSKPQPIIQTKNGVLSKTQHDFETLTFKEFLEDELFVNKGEIPEVLLDLVGKKYSVPNGEFIVGQKLIEGLRDYPYNHKLVKRLIKYLPDEFLIDLYERFPFTDFDEFIQKQRALNRALNSDNDNDDSDYDSDDREYLCPYIDQFSDIWDPILGLMELYIYEGRFEPYKKIYDNRPGSDDGYIQRSMFELDSRYYNLGKDLDYDVKKKFLIHSVGDYPGFDPMDKDIIEIFIEEGLKEGADIYDVISSLFNGDHSDDVNILENVHKYHNFFFGGMDSIEVNRIVDDMLRKYKKNTSNKPQDKQQDEVIIDMINRLRNPVMTKSAAKT